MNAISSCAMVGLQLGRSLFCNHLHQKTGIHYFGEVKDKKMHLSEMGIIADTCWREIPAHFPFVKLGTHIVMPDHVHGIIIIDKNGVVGTQNFASLQPSVEPSIDSSPKNKFGPQSQNLGSIIRGFKVGVTKGIRQLENNMGPQQIGPPMIGTQNFASLSSITSLSSIASLSSITSLSLVVYQPPFGWQPRYHDTIIRDEESFIKITNYIDKNPENW
ncbi:MAG: transposase [Bacteroidia bacterium]